MVNRDYIVWFLISFSFSYSGPILNMMERNRTGIGRDKTISRFGVAQEYYAV